MRSKAVLFSLFFSSSNMAVFEGLAKPGYSIIQPSKPEFKVHKPCPDEANY